MSDEHKPLRQMIWERFISKSVDWIVVVLLGGLILMIFEPVKDRAMAIWNTPDALNRLVSKVETVLDDMKDVRDDIEALRQPSVVFEVSAANTFPVDGRCIEREPCAIQVKLRRVPGGVLCRIVSGSTQWGFINPRSDVFAPAQRLGTPSGRNIGLTWTTIDITLITPIGLQPTADFVFEASYINCPGMVDGDEPLSFRSPRIPFRIAGRN